MEGAGREVRVKGGREGGKDWGSRERGKDGGSRKR